jgi:hypothetical protein
VVTQFPTHLIGGKHELWQDFEKAVRTIGWQATDTFLSPSTEFTRDRGAYLLNFCTTQRKRGKRTGNLLSGLRSSCWD